MFYKVSGQFPPRNIAPRLGLGFGLGLGLELGLGAIFLGGNVLEPFYNIEICICINSEICIGTLTNKTNKLCFN